MCVEGLVLKRESLCVRRDRDMTYRTVLCVPEAGDRQRPNISRENDAQRQGQAVRPVGAVGDDVNPTHAPAPAVHLEGTHPARHAA